MEKFGLSQEGNPFLATRLRQFALGTQVAAIVGILNIVLFGENVLRNDSVFILRLDLIAFAIGLVGTSFLHILLKHGHSQKAVISFFWLWSTVIAFSTWYTGGLYSPLILCFPLLFIFAAILTQSIVLLSICSFLFFVLIFMGLNHVYDWFSAPAGMLIEGIPRLISVMILTALTSFMCWILGGLIKNSVEEIRRKNQSVTQSQDVIKKLAACDALTGLLNRNGAESGYQILLDKINFNREYLVGYFIDLDNFKNINDLFDHHAGDRLLATMSRRLSQLLPKEGFACRFGGDEFVIVLRVARSFDHESFATKIMKALGKPHSILGTEAEMTASIGIAMAGNSQANFTSLCKKADLAMYKAKQSGKNKYHVYSDGLKREYMRNLKILNSLKNALSDNLLDVYFQPKINLQSNNIVGAEALLRWNRGNDKSIGPEEFIPIIESTELIHTIGAWVVNKACQSCKEWQPSGKSIKVAVNVSALQLTRPNFYQVVVDALTKNSLVPELLEIEITEHSLLKEVPLVKKQLEALKKLGVGLAIDDFGTGYSNMGYLTRMQIDVLKLDRSFVSQVSQSQEHHIIVTAVIKMAQVLGMKVVAEGIETESDREVLKGLNCDFGQGFLWSPAVPGSELPELIDYFQYDKG